jgi:four helix bundle protein
MLKIDDLKVYNLSMELADRVRIQVLSWEYFHKDTIGKQLVRAVDSIAANISEGYGRFHYKENKTVLLFRKRLTV